MLFANNLSYRQLRKINPQLHHAYYGDWRREQKVRKKSKIKILDFVFRRGASL